MDNLGFTIEEVPVTKIEKLYTCTECGFKIQADVYKIRNHCAKHKVVKVKQDTSYQEPEISVKDTEGRGFEVSYTGSAVFQSEEQAEELCYLLQATAEYYSPVLAEVSWSGPGKYLTVSVKSGGMGETTESITFTKENV